ncbi:hypothetical protein F4777DRAFT_91542 [Nemania sp. FL0916]|nr:hypothetical protein F4777DRAFT_91542 [Nemania sp. FL0916]
MPRILPWKRREGEASTRPSPARPIKREKIKQERDDVASVASSDAGSAKKNTPKRPHRSASTSPPPEPLDERFMEEGIEGDDRYRMVEDEFLATAQRFTAHLHVAEYKRLKKAAEADNAQTIRNISRPVLGPMTELVKIKRDREVRAEKQRLAVKKLRTGEETGGESEGDDSWQNMSLHGLMESPRKRARQTLGLPSATPMTRAAAGYHRQMGEVVSPSRPKTRPLSDRTHRPMPEDDDDDLESPSIARRITQPALVSSGATRQTRPQINKSPLVGSAKKSENQSHVQQKEVTRTSVSDDDDLDFIARMKKRQAERRQSRGQRRTTSSKVQSDLGNILPDFL